MRPSLALIAGPNGAGKSTLYATRVVKLFAGDFINADIIQLEELGDKSMQASYEAARIAKERREAYLAAGRSFVTETVFSHPSKLDIIHTARDRGYDVSVFHVGVETPDLSVRRVQIRCDEGGHNVPEDKIRARYYRGQPFIRDAVLMADNGLIFDNSITNQQPKHKVSFKRGKLIHTKDKLPSWILKIYESYMFFPRLKD